MYHTKSYFIKEFLELSLRIWKNKSRSGNGWVVDNSPINDRAGANRDWLS